MSIGRRATKQNFKQGGVAKNFEKTEQEDALEWWINIDREKEALNLEKRTPIKKRQPIPRIQEKSKPRNLIIRRK